MPACARKEELTVKAGTCLTIDMIVDYLRVQIYASARMIAEALHYSISYIREVMYAHRHLFAIKLVIVNEYIYQLSEVFP